MPQIQLVTYDELGVEIAQNTDWVGNLQGHAFVQDLSKDSIIDGLVFQDEFETLPTTGNLGFTVDSLGIARPFKSNSQGELLVSSGEGPALPAPGTPNTEIAFVRYFSPTLGGNEAAVDLRGDGSGTALTYTIPAKATSDLYITAIQLYLTDGTVRLGRFGNIDLLNSGGVGFDIILTQNGVETSLCNKALTCAELLAQSDATTLFGDSNHVNIMSNVVGNTDGFLVNFNLSHLLDGAGLRLGAGTGDSIKVVNNDDLQNLGWLQVRALGKEVLS